MIKRSACLAFSTLLLVPVYVQDAPPAPTAGAAAALPAADLSTPDKTVRTFLNACIHVDFRTASRCVAGAAYTDQTVALEKHWRSIYKDVPPSLGFVVTVDALNTKGNTATLTCEIHDTRGAHYESVLRPLAFVRESGDGRLNLFHLKKRIGLAPKKHFRAVT